MFADDASRRQTGFTAAVIKIKEGNEWNLIVLTAHCSGKNYIAEGIVSLIEDVIKGLEKYLDRWRKVIEKTFPSYEHATPLSTGLHLVKLQGQFVSLDNCNKDLLVRNKLCYRIDNVTEEKRHNL